MNTRRGTKTSAQGRRNNGGGRQSKIRGKTRGELRLDRFIELAEYEVNVDPYRGMMTTTMMMMTMTMTTTPSAKQSPSPNPWKKCQWGSSDSCKTSQNDNDDKEEDYTTNDVITQCCACQCPSLITWTEQAQTLQLREQKRKSHKRKRNTHPANAKKSDNGGGGNDESSSIPSETTNTTSTIPTVCTGRRRDDPSFRYICDYNPFCLGSLGGAVDDKISDVAQNWRSIHQQRKEETRQEQPQDSNENEMNTDTDHSVAVENHNSPSTMSEVIDVDNDGSDNNNDTAAETIKVTNTSAYYDNDTDPGEEEEEEESMDVFHAGAIYLKDPEKEMELDPEKDTSVYSKATAEELLCLRRSVSVEIESIRSHVETKVMETLIRAKESSPPKNGGMMDWKSFLQKLHRWHDEILFSNPLQPADLPSKSSPPTVFTPHPQQLQLAIPPGIENLGATCYLNSQLQCLAQNLAFLRGIFSWREPLVAESDTTNPQNTNRQHHGGRSRMHLVLSQMQELLARMLHGAECTVTTEAFSNALGIEHDEMQDPNEFARLLLERMHETFQQCAKEEGDSSEVARDLANLLPSIFHGVTTYETTCLSCQYSSKRSESFMDLNLQIVPLVSGDKKSRRGADSDVQDCIDSYVRAEVMEGENQYWCEACQKKQDAARAVKFSQLPPVLNVQLSRYVFDREKFVKKKLRDKVLLPEVLYVPRGRPDNLKDTEKGGRSTNTTAADRARYLLCAVLKHQGTSAYRGHYISQAMNWETGKWYEFNDEQVTILNEGPSSAYDPSKSNCGKHSDGGKGMNEKISKVQGCSDAYNLYYVEASYFATCVKDGTADNRDAKLNDSGKIDLREKIRTERSERYTLLSQMCLNDANIAKRLEQRRVGILKYMFQKQVSDALWQYPSEEDCRSSVWVDGDVLRRFLSCKDTLESLLNNPRGVPLLRHKHLLCTHKNGLHPRVARRGKLLPRQVYDAYVSLLLGEQNMLMSTNLSGQTESPLQRHEDVNDCIITPECNLYCAICAESYRKELATKVENTKQMMELYNALDPKKDYDDKDAALDAEDPIENEANQYMYVVSRKFISSFRSAVSEMLKKTDTSAGVQTSKGKNAAASLCEGLDALDFSPYFPGLEGVGSLKSDGTIEVDQSVNGSITCEHGKCKVANNKRVVRHVPWKVWRLVKLIFPKAICHSKKRNSVSASVECSECAIKIREERQKLEEETKSILEQTAKDKRKNADARKNNECQLIEVDSLGPENLTEDLQAETKREDAMKKFPLQVFEVKSGSSVEAALATLAQNEPGADSTEQTLRRSSRRRKTKYPADVFLSEGVVNIGYGHNLAALRLFLYETFPGFPVDQELVLVLPFSAIGPNHCKAEKSGGDNAMVSNGSAEEHKDIEVIDMDIVEEADDVKEAVNDEASSSFPTVIPLPYEWNQRTLQDVLQPNNAWGTAKNGMPTLLRLPAIEKEGGRHERIAKREQNEVLMDSLLEVANISTAIEANTKQEKNKRTRVERGFRGTLLHTSLDEKTVENLNEDNRKSKECDKEEKLPSNQIPPVDEKNALKTATIGESIPQCLKPSKDDSKAGLVVILDESDDEETPCPATQYRSEKGVSNKQTNKHAEKVLEDPVRPEENARGSVEDCLRTRPQSPNHENSKRRRRKNGLAEDQMTRELHESLAESLGKQVNHAKCRDALRWARQQNPDANMEQLKNAAFMKFL